MRGSQAPNAVIDGQFLESDTGKRFDVTDPATGAVVASVPDMGAAETRRAIEAADRALGAWRARTAQDRADILMRWYALILDNQETLAQLLTAENGKPIAESRGEVVYGASFVRWYAEEARRIYGDIIPTNKDGARILVLRQAIGVAAAITPWNFPIATVTRKIAPGIAAGCTLVLKPAEQTPLCAMALAELGLEAGLPAGVLNVVTGADAAAIGGELTANDTVRKLTFTGSTEVGRLLMRQSAPSIKKLSLELGGNAPFIVFDDADLDTAVEAAMACKFRNAGQTCVCANRIYAQDGIHDAFVAALAARVAAMQVGDGRGATVEIGPLIDTEVLAKVERHIADATSKGAEIRVGGARHALGGTYYQPTLLTGAGPDMVLAREETFGPVAPVFRFRDEDEVVALANDTEYGLAAYFCATDLGRVWRVAEALEYGMVGINSGLISNEIAPFGGVKHSGLGREGSRYGIEEFTEMKYLHMGGINRAA
ncbi:NAD-dependent succinate-semialdehyde dehydrogenase [Oricola sp.]|uniref:NAD-dependent succinate-semialdehyde dehydrogenase n=1 Tax=Oricola sp. TaxID=1979950 RepID=UPI0025E828E6|nr:NAD-dependent succinate-semialdehyde dehydrogenase [Oricola sp.]MCI5075249.1 NAD-dependent succinate-semialdehyde dehydrogenase [Oricola sp.]